jgi:hypothetical protein
MGIRPITKPVRRPKKIGADLRRREKAQRKRLKALGVPEERLRKLNSKQVRELLRRPAKLGKLNG